MRLADKVVAITGAGRGLGRIAALRMAAEGAKVVVSDSDPALGEETVTLIRQSGGEAALVRCDVTRSNQVKALMEAVVQRYGRLDVLINNARALHVGRLLDVPEEEFDRVVEVNLKGVFLSLKHAIPIMVAQKSGAIINVSSLAGLRGAPALAAYNAALGGVTLLTFNAAIAYGGQGVRCNCLCPNALDGAAFASSGAVETASQPALPEAVAARAPTGRIESPEEVVDLMVFLASDESRNINGAAIPIDGGLMSRL